MKTYNISRLPTMITLGYDGENNWRPQTFDCSPLLANHPNGTISLWLLPHGETQAFPVALTRDGDSVVWTPLSEEMTAATGALQLVCTDGTDVGKSPVAMFRVDSSIIPGAEHPAAVPSWATQTIERTENAADRAEEAAESIDIDAIEAQIAQAVEDYLIEHPVSVTVDSALSSTSENPVQNKVINAALDGKGTYTKPSGGIPKSDLASAVQTSLSKADTALQTATLQTALDDNVPPARFVLVRNGNTITTVDQYISIANLLVNTPRRVMFVIAVSQSGGTITSALELYPTMINANNRAMTLAGYFDGVRYTAELTAASVSSTMTGTLVAKSIVTASDIPAVSTAAPLMDGTAAVGTSDAYAREDHVHPSDTTRLAVNQGAANAGKFMVVGNDGNIAPVAMSAWQGGSF